MHTTRILASLVVSLSTACAGPADESTIAENAPAPGAGGTFSGGSGGTKPGIEPGGAGGTGGSGGMGAACGQQEFALTATVSDLFIVLDRSCSMGGGSPSKWSEAVNAVEKLVYTFAGTIRIGLALFPDLDEDSCRQGDSKTLVPIGENTQSAISNVLHLPLAQPGVYGACDTNIDAAIEQLSKQQALISAASGYGLLITDGKQNDCAAAGGDAGTLKLLEQLRASGVETFIVGFKGGVDPAAMNAFAETGGVPKSGAEKYYQADNGPELEAALASIGGKIADCKFSLAETPENSDLLYVFLDDQPVERDPTHHDGWDYDPADNSIEFFGAECAKLEQGQISDVDVVFGCNQPSPH